MNPVGAGLQKRRVLKNGEGKTLFKCPGLDPGLAIAVNSLEISSTIDVLSIFNIGEPDRIGHSKVIEPLNTRSTARNFVA